MNVETMNSITAGATPVQMLMLFCLGCCFFWCVFSFVRWLIKIKIAHLDSLPQDIKEIKDDLAKHLVKLASMDNKLWSEEKIKAEFSAAIEHHKNECPAWRRHCDPSRCKEDK